MSTPFQPPAAATARRSKNVALVLLGTMGVVGGVIAWDAWKGAGASADAATTQPEAGPPVAADRTYTNNEFIPGVGYYHAPYHSWHPFPYNHHDPERGYFAGGLWQAVPFALGMMSSRPSNDAVTSALAAQQRRDQEQRAHAGTSGFAGGSARPRNSSFGGSSFSTRPSGTPSSSPAARPASSPSPSKPSPTIQRGGFGSSGKGASGSGSS